MILHDYTQSSTLARKYLIKRKTMKDEANISNGSIFSNNFMNQSIIGQGDSIKKYQTMTTNIEKTITINSNNEEAASTISKSQREDKNDILPKITATTQAYDNKKSSFQTICPKVKAKQRSLTCHASDPLYLRLQKTIVKRVTNKFKEYQRGWVQSCLKRKEKSVIQRSIQKSITSIEHINTDARKRRNTTHLSELLRDNVMEKTFIYPAQLKPNIIGLKGTGGKNVIPLFSQVFMAEEVYMIDKS